MPQSEDRPTDHGLTMHRRVVVITGVSRRQGIGFAVACRLVSRGASVLCQHFAPHDAVQPWGGDDVEAVLAEIREHARGSAQVVGLHADLTVDGEPERVVAAAHDEFGRLDGLVCNQAQSGEDGPLGALTARELDRHWQVDARASILLAQEFAARCGDSTGGSIVFMTSGQGQGPLPGEVAYAAAKAAIAGVTLTLSDQLADRGIRVNTVNPGPVDTGYLDDEMWEAVRSKFPLGRFGRPEDAARLVTWLLEDDSGWITGQTINSEGGFARWRT